MWHVAAQVPQHSGPQDHGTRVTTLEYLFISVGPLYEIGQWVLFPVACTRCSQPSAHVTQAGLTPVAVPHPGLGVRQLRQPVLESSALLAFRGQSVLQLVERVHPATGLQRSLKHLGLGRPAARRIGISSGRQSIRISRTIALLRLDSGLGDDWAGHDDSSDGFIAMMWSREVVEDIPLLGLLSDSLTPALIVL